MSGAKIALGDSPPIRVWDIWVRLFHWTFALALLAAWASAQVWETLHDVAGYVAGALLLFRVTWGFLGSRYARFSQFVRSPKQIFQYVGAIVTGSEARFVGHNPAGGAMIVVLFAGLALTIVTGWSLTTDAFWGAPWAQDAHSILAHGALVLVSLHVGGVASASLRHRENLVRAMIFGDKRRPGPADVD